MQKSRIDILTPRVREVTGDERDAFDRRWRNMLDLDTATIKRRYNRRNRMHGKHAVQNYHETDGHQTVSDLTDRELRQELEWIYALLTRDFSYHTDFALWQRQTELEEESRSRGGFEDIIPPTTYDWDPYDA